MLRYSDFIGMVVISSLYSCAVKDAKVVEHKEDVSDSTSDTSSEPVFEGVVPESGWTDGTWKLAVETPGVGGMIGEFCFGVEFDSPMMAEAGVFSWTGEMTINHAWPDHSSVVAQGTIDSVTINLHMDIENHPDDKVEIVLHRDDSVQSLEYCD